MVSFTTVFLPAMFLHTCIYVYTYSRYILAAVYRLKNQIPEHGKALIPKQSNENSQLRLQFMG